MAKNKKSHWIVSVVLVLAVATGLGFVAWRWKSSRDGALQYQSAAVARGDLTQAVTATGQLNPVVNVQVGSQISGIIQKVFVDFNSLVKADQIVAEIDAASYRANVLQAEGQVANAKAGLELARVDAARAEELYKQKLLPQSDYDKSIATLHQTEASVKISEAALEKTKVDLARCTISSPVDGIVISRNVDVGQTVAAGLNVTTLFVIANDLTKMQIDANVAEADVGGVEVGQDVDFTVDAFPYRTFRGKVVQVRNAPITVQNVVTYDTVIEVSNPDLKLKPGMTANVSIIIARRDNALKIPNAALRFRPPEGVTVEKDASIANAPSTPQGAPTEQLSGARPSGGARPGGSGGTRKTGERQSTRTVHILTKDASGNNKLRAVQIKTGINDGTYTEVTDGLKEGDVVVTGATGGPAAPAPASNPFGGPGGPRRF
jgi:HlyD family secretion protein